MAIELLLKGLMIGFSIAMPVGPIGLLCLRNVFTYGMFCGVVTGLGASCADAIYGALAGFGVTTVSSFLQVHGNLFQISGALFLCYLGISTFFTNSSKRRKLNIAHPSIFLATFFLTLTNPMTIISFACIYAGLGVGCEASGVSEALIITCGVFLGSLAWWLILSLVASIFRDKIGEVLSVWLNKISGSILFGFGAITLIA